MTDEALSRILTVHDHLGMWAAVGYRAGQLAMEKLRPGKIKELTCSVKLTYRTPVSCILDGIQAGSCCTTGKCNLRYEQADGLPQMVFENTKTGEKLTLRPRAALVEKMGAMDRHDREEENTKWILSLAAEEIFESVG